MRTKEEIRKYLESHMGTANHPRAEKLFRMAWEWGHASGENEVESIYYDLLDLMPTIIPNSRETLLIQVALKFLIWHLPDANGDFDRRGGQISYAGVNHPVITVSEVDSLLERIDES